MKKPWRGLAACVGLIALLGAAPAAWAQGVITTNPEFPPDTGYYVSADPLWGMYDISPTDTVYLWGAVFATLADTTVRVADGPDEIQDFAGTLTCGAEGTFATEIVSMSLTGPVTTRVSKKVGNTTGLFDAEIVSMSLSGNVPLGPVNLLIRESPSAQSTGKTDITDLGGGLYHIDSFFDVFTELSVDGGMTWIPGAGSTRMTLEPEPATLGLLTLGALALLRRRRKA